MPKTLQLQLGLVVAALVLLIVVALFSPPIQEVELRFEDSRRELEERDRKRDRAARQLELERRSAGEPGLETSYNPPAAETAFR